MSNVKKVLIISDGHSGHYAGLASKESLEKYGYLQTHQQALIYNWFKKNVLSLGHFDLVVDNGDCIDGKGQKSGGRELHTSDRIQQANIYCDSTSFIKTKKRIVIRGTNYHVGSDEQWEDVIAEKLKSSIKNHLWCNVGGLIIDIKHKVKGTKNTFFSKAKINNLLWAEMKGQPRADIIIRSHAHYYFEASDGKTTAFITPALQGWGSEYGEKECDNTVDIGFLYLEIKDKVLSFKPFLFNVESISPEVYKI